MTYTTIRYAAADGVAAITLARPDKLNAINADMHADLRAALAAAGFAFDPKPFVSHVTLVRKAQPGFVMPALAPIRWQVTDFVLVRSVMRPAGSDYPIEARWG